MKSHEEVFAHISTKRILFEYIRELEEALVKAYEDSGCTTDEATGFVGELKSKSFILQYLGYERSRMDLNMSNHNGHWTNNPPTKPGWYWAYVDCARVYGPNDEFDRREREMMVMCLHVIEVPWESDPEENDDCDLVCETPGDSYHLPLVCEIDRWWSEPAIPPPLTEFENE